MVMINKRELDQQFRTKGMARAANDLCESLDRGHLKPSDFSIRALCEAVYGYEFTDGLHPKYGGAGAPASMFSGGTQTWSDSGYNTAGALTEANRGAAGGQAFGSAVNSAAFANITGQIFYNALLEAYKMDDLVGEQLCTIVPTELNGERIAGIGGIGDEAEIVREGEQYPFASPNEQWIDTPQTDKRGFIVPLTREAIFFDRTGQLLQMAAQGGEYAAINREKRMLDNVIGATNTYTRNGVATDTYLSTGAYVNQQQNAPADFTDIEASEALLYAMLDPNTGEPMKVDADTIVCEFAQRYAILSILQARYVMRVDNQTNAGTLRTEFPNPISNSLINAGPYTVVTNRYVGLRNTAASQGNHWYMGNFKKAFMYMQNWPITSVQAAANSHDEFHRDIVQQYKVTERGVTAVREPRTVVENTD